MPRTRVKLVSKGSGYGQLMKEIRQRDIDLMDVKIVVVLIGRQDVLDRSEPYLDRVQRLVQVIHRIKSTVVVLFCSPLPWPGDSEVVARKLFRTAPVLRRYCRQQGPLVQYSRAAQQLVAIDGVDTRLLNHVGLTTQGVQLIQRLIDGKIQCSKLRHV